MLMSLFMFHLLYLQDQIITAIYFLTLNIFQFQLLLYEHLEKISLKFYFFFLLTGAPLKFHLHYMHGASVSLCIGPCFCVIYYWFKYIMYKYLFYTRCFQHDHKASHLHVKVTTISNSHAILVQNLKYGLEIYCLLGTVPLKCISHRWYSHQ